MRERLTTERLVLRRWEERDREPFAALNADGRVMEFLPKRLTRMESDAMVDRMERHFAAQGFGLFAAELRESGALIGYVGLAVPEFAVAFTPCVEIGWRLACEYWGRGLATEGARAVLRFAFEEAGLPEVVSFTAPANVRSVRVMEKLGMEPAGEFEHPRLPVGHALRRHVLYRLGRAAWERAVDL